MFDKHTALAKLAGMTFEVGMIGSTDIPSSDPPKMVQPPTINAQSSALANDGRPDRISKDDVKRAK